ncbi:hypothetical protein KVR01_001305 [Diaporthe batatas]|uniref:uncharacterized protein n=1 Tax=Diaporthe batatas TaxID=748121 RepID=UPI001D03D14D|nr:uncharacterized protein KVR01_001305 [Diaporthe batatas]KAG8168556.1 hypothetical protein KVR01_001305 [Diaporthe batatas]
MGFLWYRRDTPLLRIRDLNLSFAAIGFLHTYWMAVQMAYIVKPFPPQAEYWIMGIYLPFGIALFHASNSRFLYVARQQRRSHTRKMLVVIGMGMGLQLFLTVLMYLLSKKFHPSFGVPGTEVALNNLAVLLVLDSSSCCAMAGKTDTRHLRVENTNTYLLPRRTISAVEKSSTIDSVGTAYSGESMLSMGALEYVLEHNPDPLRQFSALKDFSGENVAFLTAVAEWRSRYRATGEGEAAREAYNKALHIYVDFISPKDAEFPINISFQDKTGLEAIFEKAARVLYGDRGLANSQATPFAPGSGWPREAQAGRPSHASERPIIGSRTNSNADVELRAMADRIAYWGEIPATFDGTVFDRAETSIKYLVLTNTWPKFSVKDIVL